MSFPSMTSRNSSCKILFGDKFSFVEPESGGVGLLLLFDIIKLIHNSAFMSGISIKHFPTASELLLYLSMLSMQPLSLFCLVISFLTLQEQFFGKHPLPLGQPLLIC